MSIPDEFPEIIARFYDLPDEFYKTLIDSLDSGVCLVDLGGDEFVVLVKDIDADLLEKMAAKAGLGVGAAEMPDAYEGQTISVSIGAVMVEEDDTPVSVISRADKVMYQVKQAKKSGS